MAKTLAMLGVLLALTLFSVSSAEARIFEPQQNWWHSGQTCVATRGPPGRRWRALPPRSCTHTEGANQTARSVEAHALAWEGPTAEVRSIGDGSIHRTKKPGRSREASPVLLAASGAD